jgi:predicted LPLAT superfamily acyltransferase
MVMSATSPLPHNPGPSWGYSFLLWAERWWPRWFFRLMLMAGTWVGVALMPAQRAHSRAYLSVVLGRPPGLQDVWRHFFAFADFLVLKLRTGRGAAVRCVLEPENKEAFEALLDSGQPALFGTFHFGASDLLGYLLGERGIRVSIIRLRVGNSDDTRLLGQRFAERVSFLWVNNPANLLFDLKAAIEAGDSLALKCDRPEFSGKTEPFHFLGTLRLFPFTIYHLALLFGRPVVFCTAVPDPSENKLRVIASPVFAPDPTAGREANSQAARAHFQAVLARLEALVRQHPFLWFNFLPLNPEAPAIGR